MRWIAPYRGYYSAKCPTCGAMYGDCKHPPVTPGLPPKIPARAPQEKR